MIILMTHTEEYLMKNIGIENMTWIEMRNSTKLVKKLAEDELGKSYPFTINENGKRIFHTDKAGDFYICALGEAEPWNFLVVAYKEEDGYSFYPSDYDSFEALIADMTEEIEDFEPDD